MKAIDLTHTIWEDMPVYPGTAKPALEIAHTYEAHGFKETRLNLLSHTGTHMDAPAHLFAGRTTLDAFPVAQFIGTGLVIDCSALKAGESITMEHIAPVKKQADGTEFLLFYTGWDRHWGTELYFGEYPHINGEVAEYLLHSGKKGVGLDVISIDPVSDANLTIHKKLLGEADIVIIENLTRLGEIGMNLFTLCVLPLKYENADGAPIRAAAILQD